jgi:hypothetical protein
MNRENVSALFQSFFAEHLAPRGFVLRTRSFAERILVGVRQGVIWTLDESAGFNTFGCHAFWSFTHELDNATPNTGLGAFGKSLSGGNSELGITGIIPSSGLFRVPCRCAVLSIYFQ